MSAPLPAEPDRAPEPPSLEAAEGVTDRPPRVEWRRGDVDGRPAHWGDVGTGAPLVFLHGWALTNRTYVRALKRLVGPGRRLLAPSLPGFGDTADLPEGERSLPGYAAWVGSFLDAVGVEESAVVLGHSFGGGVAVQLAHDDPARVRGLVLLNSIGGSAWSVAGGALRSMAERPLWDWGLHLSRDLLPTRQVTRVLPVILRDAVPNLVRRPRAFWRAAAIARRADLTAELQELRDRELPIVVLWGDDDHIVPEAATDALVEALGHPEVVTVHGSHSWMLADPEAFGEIMTNVLPVAQRLGAEPDPQPPVRRRRRRGRRAGPTEPA